MSLHNMIQARAVLATLATAATLACGPAQAASITTLAPSSTPSAALTSSDLVVNLAGVNSYDQQGATINTVLTLDALPGSTVDLIAWNFNLSTVGLSWLSEATMRITNSDGVGVAFNAGDGDDLAGTRSYAGSGSLLAAGFGFSVLADGKLYLEFYETWDDVVGSIDSVYQSGSLTLSAVAAVPEPSAYGLMGLGLLGVAVAARRRSARRGR